MSDKNLGWTLSAGDVVEVDNQSLAPLSVRIEYADGGSVEFAPVFGRKFRLTGGTLDARIILNDGESVHVDGVNIVRLDDHR